MDFLGVALPLAFAMGLGVTFLATDLEAKGFLGAALGAGFWVDIFNP
ncbi:MAG: hypothetical protein WCJ99_01230 [Betaproteobacteria bacterium]|jgi:hypothetical protein